MIGTIPTVADVMKFWKSCRDKNAAWDTNHGYQWDKEEMEMIRFLRALSHKNSDWLVFMSNSTIADTFREPVDPESHIAYSPINFMTHFASDVRCKFNEAEFLEAKNFLGVDSVPDLPITEYVNFRGIFRNGDYMGKKRVGRIPASITIPYVKIRPLDQCHDWLRKIALEARNNYVRSYFDENTGLAITKASIPSLMLHRLETIGNPYHWVVINSASNFERRLVMEKRLAPRETITPTQSSLRF